VIFKELKKILYFHDITLFPKMIFINHSHFLKVIFGTKKLFYKERCTSSLWIIEYLQNNALKNYYKNLKKIDEWKSTFLRIWDVFAFICCLKFEHLVLKPWWMKKCIFVYLECISFICCLMEIWTFNPKIPEGQIYNH